MRTKNIKKTIGLGLALLALVFLANTLYGSVFYASNDRGVDPTDGAGIGIIETSTSTISIPENTVIEGGTTSSDQAAPSETVSQITTSTPNPVTKTDSNLPVRLLIPSLKIDANIQYVGVNAKGNMGTPNNFTDVSWYKPGTIPGEIGSAVMAGHVNNGLSLPGVFSNLEDLTVGDDVYVTQKDGTKLHFKVIEIKSYHTEDVPADFIFASKDGSRLNLITCVGSWLPSQKTYDRRLVVYTKLVE